MARANLELELQSRGGTAAAAAIRCCVPSLRCCVSSSPPPPPLERVGLLRFDSGQPMVGGVGGRSAEVAGWGPAEQAEREEEGVAYFGLAEERGHSKKHRRWCARCFFFSLSLSLSLSLTVCVRVCACACVCVYACVCVHVRVIAGAPPAPSCGRRRCDTLCGSGSKSIVAYALFS